MSFCISNVIKFPQNTLDNIPQENYNKQEPQENEPLLLGGILSDTKHVWHAKGPCIEVRNIVTGKKLGAWTFGCILKDSNTNIVCVDEVKRPYGRLPLLAVGINCTISGGLVCIFDAFGSKVVRAIQIGEQITSIHVIDSGCDNLTNKEGLLKYFDGIIAIGCQGGNVLLVDICRQICDDVLQNIDINVVRDELCPCQLKILYKDHLPKIQKYAAKSVREGVHLAFHLNAVLNTTTEHFTLKGENGEDRLHVNQSEVEVSSLYYSPHLSSLLIGYNFGAFQIWHLPSLELEYTSPVCEEHLSVTHFAIQEPADDPKAYCYVWVAYSNSFLFQDGVPYAVLYSLYFDKKKTVPGCGQLYEDFQHCSVRFQIELGQLRDSRIASKIKGGYCMGLQSITKSSVIKDLHSLALCLITWTLWVDEKQTETCVLLFDLNQWYKEQMPNEINWKNCSNYTISHAIKGSLLDVKLDQKSVCQFIGVQRLEEHFCPTSLSFDLWGLNETNIQKYHNESLQQSLLTQLENAGPLCLARPNDFFDQIISLGLTPLFDDASIKIPSSLDYQRKLVLDVALEQKLVGFLCRCASEWANGSFSSAGLSLEFFISWAFKRATVIKQNCDEYCVPLFDYSGSALDNNTILLLSNCITQLKNICCVYNYLFSKLIHFIYNLDQVNTERVCLQNVSTYFDVILWLVNVKLLPEYHASSRPNLAHTVAPYLVDDLTEYYNQKRAHLKQLSRETFVESDSLLYVDSLINNRCGGHSLQQQWQQDGGSGLYPPPSLQSMLRTYLVSGPEAIHKHTLVTYVLLDVAMTLDEDKFPDVVELLCRFPHIFQLTQSNIKIIQGCWHLDHGNYEIGMENILDPCVHSDDLQEWHHKVIMRSLLLQEQSSSALLYMQIKKPPIVDENDVLTVLSLLVSKNLLDEAFYFEQQYRGSNASTLLTHVFNECNKNGLLHGVLYRTLTNSEEQTFFKYLEKSKSPNLEELKVFYYLLRSRFLEAFDSHDLYKKRKPESQGLIGQKSATPSDSVVRMFKTLLPDVNRNLVDVLRRERTGIWKEVERPTPLSVFVHNSKEKIQYNSTTIYAALAKAKQTFNDTLNASHKDIRTEETPFLRTPVALRNTSCQRIKVVNPETIEIDENGEELGPSPSKKMKLSPRISVNTSPIKSNITTSLLSTPIVKRKVSRDKSQLSNAYTPQSILKSKTTALQEQQSALKLFDTSRNISLGLSPRKSLSRTPIKSHVKFDDLRYSTSTSSDISKLDMSSKESSIRQNTSEDTFYSPNASGNESSSMQVVESKEDSLPNFIVNEKQIEVQKPENVIIQTPETDNSMSSSHLLQSPKSRRSYKRSIESSPVRQSPRLARKTLDEKANGPNELNTSTSSTTTTLESLKSTPRANVNARKSLSRAVLEYNTYLKSKDISLDISVKDRVRDTEMSKDDDIISDLDVSNSKTINEESVSALDTNKVIERKKVKGRKSITRSFTNTSKNEIPPQSLFQSNSEQNVTQSSYSKSVTYTSYTRIFEEFRNNEAANEDNSNSSIASISDKQDSNEPNKDSDLTKESELNEEQDIHKEPDSREHSDKGEEHINAELPKEENVHDQSDVSEKKSDVEEELDIYQDLSTGSEHDSSVDGGDKDKELEESISESGKSEESDQDEVEDNKEIHLSEKAVLDENDVIEIDSSTEEDDQNSVASSNSEDSDDHSSNMSNASSSNLDGDIKITYEKQESSEENSDDDDDVNHVSVSDTSDVNFEDFTFTEKRDVSVTNTSKSLIQSAAGGSHKKTIVEINESEQIDDAEPMEVDIYEMDEDILNQVVEENVADVTKEPVLEIEDLNTEEVSIVDQVERSNVTELTKETASLKTEQTRMSTELEVLEEDPLNEIQSENIKQDDEIVENTVELEQTDNEHIETSVLNVADVTKEQVLEIEDLNTEEVSIVDKVERSNVTELTKETASLKTEQTRMSTDLEVLEEDPPNEIQSENIKQDDEIIEKTVEMEQTDNEHIETSVLNEVENTEIEQCTEQSNEDIAEEVSPTEIENTGTEPNDESFKVVVNTVELEQESKYTKKSTEIKVGSTEVEESDNDVCIKTNTVSVETHIKENLPEKSTKPVLVDKELQTTIKGKELEVASENTTLNDSEPDKSEFKTSETTITATESQDFDTIISRAEHLDDKVPDTPELVVKSVRSTHIKKHRTLSEERPTNSPQLKVGSVKTGAESSQVVKTEDKAEANPEKVQSIDQSEETLRKIKNRLLDNTNVQSPQLVVGLVRRTYSKDDTIQTPEQLVVNKVRRTYVNRLTESSSVLNKDNTVSSSSDVQQTTVVEDHDVTRSSSSVSSNSKQLTSSSTSADTPTRRLTRRSSLNLVSESTPKKTDEKEQVEKVDKRRRRSSSLKPPSVEDPSENADTPVKSVAIAKKKSTRSKSVDHIGTVLAESKESVEPKDSGDASADIAKPKPVKRTRASSVDLYDNKSFKDFPRCSLEDIEENVALVSKKGRPRSRSTRSVSVSQLPAIDETEEVKRLVNVKSEVKVKSGEAGETYTSARRLTRSQASMLKNVDEMTVDQDELSAQLDIEDMDPLKLLDKSPFKGNPDPEEQKIYETSPSNSTLSSKPTRRKSRSASVISESSLPPSVSQISTPTKTRRKSLSVDESVTVKSRPKRRTSVDDVKSVVSEISDVPSPPKRRTREKSIDVEDKATTKRGRAGSVSSVKSNKSTGSTGSATKRTTRNSKKEPDLPDISEERSSETTESSGKSSTVRQTRSRKK